MPKDDLDVEMSDDVATYLKDPKAGLLKDVLDYRDRRKAKEAEIEAAKVKKPEPEKFLGIF